MFNFISYADDTIFLSTMSNSTNAHNYAHNYDADTLINAHNYDADTLINAHNYDADTLINAHNYDADTLINAHNYDADTLINAHNYDADTLINDKTNEWLKITKLSLNVILSKFMVFHNKD